ncbi:MAG: trypsin-like peptidase domain-containing protein [Planctomycetes bacterium]|nr:trypsin-like peptidase domain-containing protein [Planctomycetota bacterium]
MPLHLLGLIFAAGLGLDVAEPEGPGDKDRARDLQEAFIAVARDAGPAVVTITVSSRGSSRKVSFGSFLGDPDEGGIGSGVIIDSGGLILTNEHVISGADEIRVLLTDGRAYLAHTVGLDPRSDLALLDVEANDLPTIRIGDSASLRIGQWAIALGNPFGIARDAQPSVTVGVISALHRAIPRQRKDEKYYGDLIQTDAAINPGNSGGPLVDIDGRLIGINVLIYSTTGGYQGIGFAIPVNRAMEIAASLRKYRKVEYGWLGVRIDDAASLPSRSGAVVKEVLDHTPASESGIQAQDVILEFDGHKVKTSDDLIRLVNQTPAGRKVSLRLHRGTATLEVQVTLRRRGEAESVSATAFSWRGMELQDIPSSGPIASQPGLKPGSGVLVIRIDPGTPAEQAGIQTMAVISHLLSEDGKTYVPVESLQVFMGLVEKREGGLVVRVGEDDFVIRDAPAEGTTP